MKDYVQNWLLIGLVLLIGDAIQNFDPGLLLCAAISLYGILTILFALDYALDAVVKNLRGQP